MASRSYTDQKLTTEQIETLLEAARWAPSCYNLQPWYIAYADSESGLKKFQSCLDEQNQAWANKAPLLMIIFAKKEGQPGKLNHCNKFDTGSAWMSIALQAESMGLTAHGIGGFISDKCFEVTGLNKNEFDVGAMVSVGYRGEQEQLPEAYRAREQPSQRKELKEICKKYD